MKNLAYMTLLMCLLLISCREKPVETAEDLIPLSEKWVEDSIMKKNPFMDTLTIEAKKYHQTLKNNLTVKKVIHINSQTKAKISETDIYTKPINLNIESRLNFSYDYTTGEYHTSFVDSTATSRKWKANQAKADSIIKAVSEMDVYLCGTAYAEILWKDISYFPIPREIDKDSALFVIEQWTNE